MKIKNILLLILSSILIIVSYIILCNYKNYIEIKDGKQNLELYKEMISYALDSNKDLTLEADYIAVDLNSFIVTNELDKNKLINYLRNYGSNILLAPFAVLNSNSFKNDDNTLKGIFLSIDDIKNMNNKVNCELILYKSDKEKIRYDVKAEYKGNRWKLIIN